MAALDVSVLSRRELQLLARELQLCRGNAKSDVIMQHVYEFVAAHPADGERRIIALVGASSDAVTPADGEPEDKSEDKREDKREEAPAADQDATDSDDASSAQPQGTTEPQPEPDRESKSPKSSKATDVAKSKAAAERRRAEPDASSAKAARASSPAAAAPVPAKAATPETKVSAAGTSELKTSSEPSNSREGAEGSKPRRALASIENAPAAASVPGEVVALVAATSDLELTKDGRVRCSLTAHEMKADLAAIQEHLRGKRYARARGLKAFSLAEFAPAFSAHPDEKLAAKLVWCNVTETAIARTRGQIEAHMTGPRYQKELPRWEEEQAAKAKAEAEAAERARARKLAAAKKRKSEPEARGKSAKPRSA